MSQVYATGIESIRQIMLAQSVNANNLANVSTAGFKGELAYVMEDTESVLQAFSAPDLSEGSMQTTGRSLDVSIRNEGWFAVLGADGTEAYSRRGDLRVDAFGQLLDGAGRSVIGNSGPVALPPFTAVEIAADGTISIQPLGQAPNTLAVVDRIKLVELDENAVYRGEDGLMRLATGLEADPSANVQLIAGSLEGSNVNAVEEMVKMIDLSRRFEAQIQLMQSEDENNAALSTIMSMS